MNLIEIKNVSKSFDDELILENINLEIKENEFLTMLGPSGCGKTTLLRILGGFLDVDSGEVLFAGDDLLKISPHKRQINTVFQKYALFPHLNVYENIAFGLRIKKVKSDIIDKKVKKMLKLVNLEGFENRSVDKLSGGQAQRIAIARALINEPKVLLLDEPLGALDLKLRKDMQFELKEMQQKLKITFVYVTHDQEEALSMSDTIIVLKDGVIQQVGTPTDIYNEPVNSFVADFIGESNILPGIMIRDKLVSINKIEYECVDSGFNPNEKIDVVIRPEDLRISNKDDYTFSGIVDTVVFKGVHYEIIVYDKFGVEWMVHSTQEVQENDEIFLKVNPNDFHIMKKMHSTSNLFTAEVINESSILLNGEKIEFINNYNKGDKVSVTINSKNIEITSEYDCMYFGEVESAIFKGSFYEIEFYDQDDNEWFVHTDKNLAEGDMVYIKINQEDIKIVKRKK